MRKLLQRSVVSVLSRLRRDTSGNVAMLFALFAIPLTALVGLAVDFGRVYHMQSHTQAALDSAALAAGRAAQLNKTSAVTAASSAASVYFDQAKPKNVVSSTLQFSPNSSNTAFTLTATSWIRTPFLSALYGIFPQGGEGGAPPGCLLNRFSCVSTVTTATSALCPSAACTGSEGGSNVEVSLMLDVTGSMCSPCSKIQAAQSAAKDLVDIVIWEDQSKYYSKIALAPFAEAVNVGTTLAPLVRGTVTANTPATAQQFTTGLTLNDETKQPTQQWIEFKHATGSSTSTWTLSAKCVTERIGTDAYTDAPPSTALVGKAYAGTNANTSCAIGNSTDPEVNSIQPLTNDAALLKRRIDKLTTGGSTAGHLGTAWAWYLLSPNWNYLFPAGSTAGPYSDLTTFNSKGMPKLRKIAVLMTDGDYNINYCKGVEAKNSDQSPRINCNSENGKAKAQATQLCSGMKAAKIEVFTVGFQVSSASKSFLTACATDANHYYDATTDVALKAAFRDIALKIATLRLTN